MSTATDMRSRRALLGAGIGALAATVASAVGRVQAANGMDGPVATYVVLSGENTGTAATKITYGGIAIHGSSGGSIGVYGETETGSGVFGTSTSGSALNGYSSGGFAVEAGGRLKLKTSGVATILKNTTSVTVHPDVDIEAGSFVLLTPRVNLGGRDLWFTTAPAANEFTIRMSSVRTTATKVSWLLLDQF